MKKQLMNVCLFAAAACAATVPGFAQSNRINVKAPFNFTVGETALPAGDYFPAGRFLWCGVYYVPGPPQDHRRVD